MPDKNQPALNKRYLIVVLALTIVLPLVSFFIEGFLNKNLPGTFMLFGKWFIFYAVGVRLFIAGIKQTTDPAFTAKEIFHIESSDSFPILRELGFANGCFGLVGIISLFLPQWRIVSAFASGLYFGIAGINHLIKKPAGINEQFALITDMLIFLILLIYFILAC